MIFEKGRHARHDFYVNDTLIELVTLFKYLGITLLKNGNWYRTLKHISEHASFALYSVFTIFDNIELSVSQKCTIYDSLVGSILNFGSEIWGMQDGRDFEKNTYKIFETTFMRSKIN
jgi:hypothetical protein